MLLERSPRKSLWVQVMLPSLQSNADTGAGAALGGLAPSSSSKIFSCTWLKNGIQLSGRLGGFVQQPRAVAILGKGCAEGSNDSGDDSSLVTWLGFLFFRAHFFFPWLLGAEA